MYLSNANESNHRELWTSRINSRVTTFCFRLGNLATLSVFTWKVYSNTLAQWNASKLAATNAISFTLFLFIYLLCLDDIHMIGYLDSYSYSGYLPKYKNKSTKWVSVCECPQKSVVSTVFFVFSNIRKGRPRSILHSPFKPIYF